MPPPDLLALLLSLDLALLDPRTADRGLADRGLAVF